MTMVVKVDRLKGVTRRGREREKGDDERKGREGCVEEQGDRV